jgi:hypothetical protein
MNKIIVGSVMYALLVGVGSQVVVHKLEQATRKQCLQHDWPIHADQLHKDWCLDNGYKI